MEVLKHIIERTKGNSTITVNITKHEFKQFKEPIFKIKMHYEIYTSTENNRSMYSDNVQNLEFTREELISFQSAIGKALLFLEAS